MILPLAARAASVRQNCLAVVEQLSLLAPHALRDVGDRLAASRKRGGGERHVEVADVVAGGVQEAGERVRGPEDLNLPADRHAVDRLVAVEGCGRSRAGAGRRPWSPLN